MRPNFKELRKKFESSISMKVQDDYLDIIAGPGEVASK